MAFISIRPARRGNRCHDSSRWTMRSSARPSIPWRRPTARQPTAAWPARDKEIVLLRSAKWIEFLGCGVTAKIVSGASDYYRKPIPPAVVELHKPLIRHATARLVEQIANQTAATRRLLEHFDTAYQRLKGTRRAMRFEDVTRKLCDAVARRRLDDVVYRLDGHVSNLLLDEFQDTAPPQWRVLRPFAGRVVDGAKGRSFFCVGNVKQAIYGWRGGVAEIFDAVEAELPRLTSQALNQSWRSSQPVIDTVNRVFENLAANQVLARYPSAHDRWAARFGTHTTARKELAGYCRLVAAPRRRGRETRRRGLGLRGGGDRPAAPRGPALFLGRARTGGTRRSRG